MSLSNYGVLVGNVINKMDSPAAVQKNPGSKPHFQILVEANNTKHRIAVNVKSDQQPSDLQFFLADDYQHPILSHIKTLPVGFSNLPKQTNTAALDYIRGNLFDIHDMKIMPTLQGGPNNDLNDIFNVHVEHAINSPGALLYAFGSKWGPENNKEDAYFDFLPGNGVHDIHMNQGNTGSHSGDNGIYQDGGLFIFYPDENRWLAMFMKFQSQVVHTDDDNADPIIPPTPQPLPEDDTAIKIFAAMVNPKGDDTGKEFVYLLNTTDKDINLDGWSIADKLKKKEIIRNNVLKAGEVIKIRLSGQSAQLSNEGGIITLLNKDGLKIHGVSYTKQQAGKQGYVIAF
ncbi:MAG: DUF2278 family protein [Chitinophagaceae bacterium]